MAHTPRGTRLYCTLPFRSSWATILFPVADAQNSFFVTGIHFSFLLLEHRTVSTAPGTHYFSLCQGVVLFPVAGGTTPFPEVRAQ
jgi:hypothetical protein